MTAPATLRAPGPTSGRPALRRLVAGEIDSFVEDVWGRGPMLSRAADLPADFTDLLDEAAVDELVSRRGLRAPFLRVAKDGTTYGDQAFTAPGGVGAGVADQVSDDKLAALFADGATLVLQGLHRVWPPLLDFAQSLAADLGHPTQVNAYVTPPQNRGFDDHYDVHDVFVLQISGEKRWCVRPPVHDRPLRSQPWTDRRVAVQTGSRTPPLLDVALRPGDCLYLPRGYLHAATALGGVSTHVTIGVHPWTRYSLAEQLVAEAMAEVAQDPEARASLGLGVAVDDAGQTASDLELVRERLLAAVAGVGPVAVAGRLGRRVREAQRAAPVGPVSQLRTAASLRGDDSLALREHLAATLLPGAGGHRTLRSRAGDVDVPPSAEAAVSALLEEGTCRVADLGVDLAKALLARAVVVAEPR